MTPGPGSLPLSSGTTGLPTPGPAAEAPIAGNRGKCGSAISRALPGGSPTWVIASHEPSVEPCRETRRKHRKQTPAERWRGPGLLFAYVALGGWSVSAVHSTADLCPRSTCGCSGSVTAPSRTPGAERPVGGRLPASSGHWCFAGWGPQSSGQRTLAESMGYLCCPRDSCPRNFPGPLGLGGAPTIFWGSREPGAGCPCPTPVASVP